MQGFISPPRDLAIRILLLILGFMLSISVKMTLVVLGGLPFFYVYVRITKPRQRRFRQLRANKLTASYENNWCTSDWKTFEGDGVNGTVDFISVLPEAENTAAVFEDLENFDLTVKAGTSVRTNKVGDPRWLK